MKVRTLIGGGIGLALLILLIAAAVLASNQAPERYPVGSPEAVVQDYFEALIDDRPDDALALLDDDLAESCHRDSGPRLNGFTVSRVVLDDVEFDQGDDGVESARVRVRITDSFGNSFFGPDESTFSETVTLTRTSGQWHISTPPWPYFDCGPVPAPGDRP